MKRLVYLSLLLMVACGQPCRQVPAETDMATNAERVLQNRSLAASNLNFYSFEGADDTRAPRGYKPFYISHYGRHGSRYMDSESEIKHVKPVMEMAEKRGILTQTGKDFHSDLMTIINEHEGIVGMLTERGASELRGMGERMPERYPEVFAGRNGRTKVNCFSSSSPRCIISMTNFVHAFASRTPKMDLEFTTGDKYYKIFAYHPPVQEGVILSYDEEVAFRRAECNPEQLLGQFFTDMSAVEEAVGDLYEFERRLFQLCCVGHLSRHGKNLFDYFPEESLLKNWEARNGRMYVAYASSKELPGYAKTLTGPILKDIVERADAAVVSGSDVAADLRFGHDVTFLPLLSHLGIKGMDQALSFEDAADNWNSSEFINMGANLQMVFYKDRSGDVLVKILRNEKETVIPALETFHGPYYRWSDLRKYLLSIQI